MGLSLVPVAELPPGRRYLRLGTKGRDVQELQRILAGLGFFPGVPHGNYDFLTREAVKDFQRAFHLAADGAVGPKTWRMLGEPGIWNRLCHPLPAGETLPELAARYGVSPGAWKDPASRRRGKRFFPGDLVLLEERELWLAAGELLEAGVFCTPTRVLRMEPATGQTGELVAGQINHPVTGWKNSKILPGKTEKPVPGMSGRKHVQAGNPGEFSLFKLSPPWTVTGREGAGKEAGGVVADLRNTLRPGRRLQGKMRQALRALRQNSRGEIFWWLAAGDKLAALPKDDEADGILLSVNTGPWFSPAVDGEWRREVKSLLARYPCTRVILQFDLAAREIGPDGGVRFLPAGSSKALRQFQPGRRQRLAGGWLQLQSSHGKEEHKFLLADRNTLRAIFSALDRLNLRGVLLTGIQGLEGALLKEAAQFFLVLSQARS
jgi:peptidoglycan hydrolase-like protein with peptidoglycan-binding domain